MKPTLPFMALTVSGALACESTEVKDTVVTISIPNLLAAYQQLPEEQQVAFKALINTWQVKSKDAQEKLKEVNLVYEPLESVQGLGSIIGEVPANETGAVMCLQHLDAITKSDLNKTEFNIEKMFENLNEELVIVYSVCYGLIITSIASVLFYLASQALA